MRVMSFDEFWGFYQEKRRFPDVPWTPSKVDKFSTHQKNTRYKQYLSRMSKQEAQLERKKEAHTTAVMLESLFRAKIIERDVSCRLKAMLSPSETLLLEQNAAGFDQSLDVAHIVPRGVAPERKFDETNVILLNHFSHMMLDTGRHPVTGESQTKEQIQRWWERLAFFVFGKII